MIEKSRLTVKNSLRVFFGLSLLELLGVVVFFLSLPRDPKNVTILGMSYFRLGVLAISALAFLVVLIVFLVFELRVTRAGERFKRFAEWLTSDAIYSIATFLGLNIILSTYLLARWLGFAWIATDMQVRIRPFLGGWLLVCVQLLVVLLVSRRALRSEQPAPWGEELTARAWPIFRGLLVFILELYALSLVGQYFRFFTPYREMLDFAIHEFHLDDEKNFPTFLSMAEMAIAVILMLYLGIRTIVRREKFAFHWIFMAAIFVFLAFDEYMELHEQLGVIIRDYVDLKGFLNFAWYLPVIPVLLILFLVYLPFLRGMTPKLRNRIILGGAVFVFGSIGLESVGSKVINDGLATFFQFVMLANVEETVELIGMAIYVGALLQAIHEKLESVRNQATIAQRVKELSHVE